MATVGFASLLFLLVVCPAVSSVTTPTFGSEDRIEELKTVTSQLTRQLMLQQLYVEEKIRSDGDSGIKQIRIRMDGTKPYFTATHSERTVACMHDHSDLIRTPGMGELIVVLNGVEFRTRHNDYKLKMPSTTSRDYHATEDIPFPEVPPEVSSQSNIDMQIIEMRHWFKAWKDSDHSVRDYRKYFKPLLCYLEGAWSSDVTKVEEPFESDRHKIDASSWKELQDQIRFTAYTGDKNFLENFAYLPTTIMNVTEDGLPVFGQWNYRILCHPIKDIDLKLSDLKLVDNLPNRLKTGKTLEKYEVSRGARFRISPYSEDREYKWDLLDQIMKQIPGKDNYRASITDDVYGLKKLDVFDSGPLNTGYYHRWYKVREKGALGETNAHRGFADRNLFVAETTQPTVAPASFQYCQFPNNHKRKTCSTIKKRFSYAIPLEIVWLTPLNSWNPFNIEYKGDYNSELGLTAKASMRNGEKSLKRAYNGTNSKAYYMTPVHFFEGGEVGKDSADTTRDSVGVLDRQGKLRLVKSSGIRIFLPEIQGLGVLRTRYPIMPVYAEGSTAWKEVEALRDIVMDMGKYMKFFETRPPFAPVDPATLTTTPPPAIHTVLQTSVSEPGPWGEHQHTVLLSQQDFNRLTKHDRTVDALTSEANGHAHSITIDYDEMTDRFRIIECDGRERCFDGHSRFLSQGS